MAATVTVTTKTGGPKTVKPKQSVSPLVQIKEIEDDPQVSALIRQNLPSNYDFEIGKTIWRIRKNPNCKTVALQFPEGLLIFSTKIGSILTQVTGVDVILMGDITYGACCVDDFTASMLGADLLVHYGHSCLVPTSVANKVDTIYVFVTIKFNMNSAVESITSLLSKKTSSIKNEELEVYKKSVTTEIESARPVKRTGKIEVESEDENRLLKVSLVSTIQFANSLIPLKNELEAALNKESQHVEITIPRSKPLSSGEILGCTAPKVPGTQLIVYVGDGRFHLEAMMMANPLVEAYRYDPYNTTLTLETFDHCALANSRSKALRSVSDNEKENPRVGVILGTLGRQGNPKPMEYVYQNLKDASYHPFVILMSEVMPAKLNLFKDVDAWVQFACPRLSIDWGDSFTVPVLTSYEAMMLCNSKKISYQSRDGSNVCDGICKNKEYSHTMDYYAFESCGPHTPNFVPPKAKVKGKT